ncbi:MAG TPA: hypothetical protein VFL95_03070 [Gemmatimonadales bacterium]|nr:hypothetical protein [Gemmatimonadales bacterium]
MPTQWLPVVVGGVIAGALDISYACLFWALKADVGPQRIFQSVASGLLGRSSFTGGAATAVLGLALHFLIAISMSVVYYLVARRWELLWKRPLLAGALYGLLLYAIMNYVVLPLSQAAPASKDRLWVVLSIVVHMILIGIPIALAARAARGTLGVAAR